IEGLAAAGCRNVLVCPRGSAIAEAARGAAVVREVPMRGDADLAFIARLWRIIRRERPHLVHLHSRRGGDLLGGIAARLASVPAVVTRRVDNPEPRWWARVKYPLFAGVIVISEGIRRVLIDEGVDPDRIFTVPSAVAVDRHRPGCDRTWLRRTFEIEHGTRVLAMVAQFIERKGHRHLIAALPRIVRRHPNVRVLLLGKGPRESAVRDEAAAAGVADYLRFAGFRDDLERVFPCLEGLVHPAEMEGLGVALLQASAAGVPCVASAVGGIPEIVRDGETGWLVPPGDAAALAEATNALLDDREGARQRGIAARRHVESAFSIPVMVEGNLAVYRSVLEGAETEG
ncbi:MAG: glycosyltransferase, partial [Gammaproteobacteria bacterium]|nr:glycosyltransferase [Gammaproteobacteria bacterium]